MSLRSEYNRDADSAELVDRKCLVETPSAIEHYEMVEKFTVQGCLPR